MILRFNVLALVIMMTFFICGAWVNDAFANNFVEPKPYTYEDFPEYKNIADGVKTIKTTGNEISVKYTPNVPYVERAEGIRSLQLLLPHKRNNDNQKYPLIIYVQGSAWLKQDVYINQANLSRFAARGYAIAIVEYRESMLAPFPAQIQDAKTAIRFMKKHAREYHIDKNNVFIWGDSSGGHTAIMTGITASMPEFDTDTYGEYSCAVNGVIDFFGPTDIRKMNEYPSAWNHREKDSPEGLLLGGVRVDENEKLASKTVAGNYISEERDIPSILIFHGTKDRLVSYNQSELLYHRLKESHKDVSMYRLTGADHGDPAFWTEQVMDIIDSFIKKHKK